MAGDGGPIRGEYCDHVTGCGPITGTVTITGHCHYEWPENVSIEQISLNSSQCADLRLATGIKHNLHPVLDISRL